jgi:outer membrane scaffolding protein for murein synthesis (MipA/OmpV family)
MTIVGRGLACLLLLGACLPRMAACQTPSPLQEWQYPGGIILYQMFQPDTPEWSTVLGGAEVVKPLYDGARPYRAETGPVINIQYQDLAFASIGEGIGVNVLHGDNYRAGIAIGYDLGRHVGYYASHLQGLGDIDPAPVTKLYGSYVISRQLPLVLRADVRQFVGGADGMIGDLEAFMPLPGSSKVFAMLAGPSFTFADHLYMQKEFGVTARQAADSGYPIYAAHGGADAIGLGFSATRFLDDHWLINADLAVKHLLGSASDSPITQKTVQGVFALSVAYRR